jgi:hypothetical protein
VGINTLYLEGGENLNFAIPSNDAKRLLLTQYSVLRSLPNEEEADRTSAVSREDTSSQQKSCDEQSEKFARYQRQSYKVPLKSGHTDHYDAKAIKCYVETAIIFGNGKEDVVDSAGNHFSGQFYEIHDAFKEGSGGPTYGEFFFHQDRVSVPGGECNIYPVSDLNEPDIRCRSEEEFNDLALKYFGTTPPVALSGLP